MVEHDGDPEVLSWDFEEDDGRDSTYVWLKTEYLIVLAPRQLRSGTIYNLITGTTVDFPDKIRQLEDRYARRKV